MFRRPPCLPALLLTAITFAQEGGPDLAAVDRDLAGSRWLDAQQRLLQLAAQATSPPQWQGLAVRLRQVAQGLTRVRQLEAALAASRAELDLQQRLHPAGNHVDLGAAHSLLADILEDLGLQTEQLAQREAALEVYRRALGDGDHQRLAVAMSNLGRSCQSFGQRERALVLLQDSLAMRRRLAGNRDDSSVAVGLNNLGRCLLDLGRDDEALSLLQESLALREQLHGGRDDGALVTGLSSLASCLCRLQRPGEALPLYERALAMTRRLAGGGDTLSVVLVETDLARCLRDLGQLDQAMAHAETALATASRVRNGQDHIQIVRSLDALAGCCERLGRFEPALAARREAHAMMRRLTGGRDHVELARVTTTLASNLAELSGQAPEALAWFEEALAMTRRLYGAGSPAAAEALSNVGYCLHRLGRTRAAHEAVTEAAAMQRRHGHGIRAESSIVLSSILCELKQFDEALAEVEAAFGRLATRDRTSAQGQVLLHLQIKILHHLGRIEEAGRIANECLEALGQEDEPGRTTNRRYVGGIDLLMAASRVANAMGQEELGLERARQAVDTMEQLGLDGRPRIKVLTYWASCLLAAGRLEESAAAVERAADEIESLWRASSARLDAESRQFQFDELKRTGAFELLLRVHQTAGDARAALATAERARNRSLLDLLEQERFEPLDESRRRARLRGDDAAERRIENLRQSLDGVATAEAEVLHRLAKDAASDPAELRKRALELAEQRRRLLAERARLVADVLPLGSPRTPEEIQRSLQDGELLLEYAIVGNEILLLLVPPAGRPIELAVSAVDADEAHRLLEAWLGHIARQTGGDERGRTPGQQARGDAVHLAAGRRLFELLLPGEVWGRVRQCRRVWIAPHRGLHLLPFETLVVDTDAGAPRYWLDAGPPIAYVPSGSALHWLRQRAEARRDDHLTLDLLAVGDPAPEEPGPPLPDRGAFVVEIQPEGQAARLGLLPGDVLVAYDGTELVDDRTLRDAVQRVAAAFEDGDRRDGRVAVGVWRRGDLLDFAAQPGPLGVAVASGRAAAAMEPGAGPMATVTRDSDLMRLRQLPPLRGARAEVQALAEAFVTAGSAPSRVRTLLGGAAREAAVFDLAARARYLHFACHGIAEEYAGQSLSMLVLGQPRMLLLNDDGFLKLDDLLQHWRGRLASAQLVVLSACRTSVGAMWRDDSPQALPIGFLFAGAASVVSSLWAVDDASTAALMQDFYRRVLGGETDRLAAFTAARQMLRRQQPDPWHWAPFLFLGSPE